MADMCGATSDVRYGPKADTATLLEVRALQSLTSRPSLGAPFLVARALGWLQVIVTFPKNDLPKRVKLNSAYKATRPYHEPQRQLECPKTDVDRHVRKRIRPSFKQFGRHTSTAKPELMD